MVSCSAEKEDRVMSVASLPKDPLCKPESIPPKSAPELDWKEKRRAEHDLIFDALVRDGVNPLLIPSY